VVEVVTNIDLEHLDYYRDIDHIKEVFLEFINKIPFYGAAVICLDDPDVADLLPLIKKRLITYGMSAQAQIRARDIVTDGLSTRFEVYRGEEAMGQIVLPMAGIHNVYNTLAAVGVGLELDIPFAVIASAMASFSGVQRRLQIKGECHGITVVDDYGHHPTEIRATLSAMRAAWPKRRLVVFFQPHRYSRTHGLMREFSTAFYEADLLYVTEIYPAGEAPIEGVNAATLVDSIQAHGHKQAYMAPALEQIAAMAMTIVKPGDVVLSLGAGSIYRAGEQILNHLQQREALA
jgi:UDP-N-acetylmuramate--alanine ligase